MDTLVIAVLSGVGFIAAYHTYGRFLARKIFNLNPQAIVPARELEDGVDFVPTRPGVVFGHHFTSIAGTGPIVGPAIAVFWGWLPALLWVVFGSIFIGAVHDLGALVVSMRSRGQTIGDVAGRMISPRARLLFLLILFLALTVVIGVFGLVIAVIFSIYPQTVLGVWISLPVAVVVGFLIYKKRLPLLPPSLAALATIYVFVYLGTYFWPVDLERLLGIPRLAGGEAAFLPGLKSAVVVWTGILLVYCFVASTLPVWTLLQPRDYVNSHQLIVALGLLFLGLLVARPELVAPAINTHAPGDAPPLFPFLFITIACGAVSGFHCLVSSGTSSKQISNERDAQFVAYGAMLLEGALAVLVIIACSAGLGMGITGSGGEKLLGEAAWASRYGGTWKGMSLAAQVGAFVDGGANMIAALGIPLAMAVGIVAVMVACFAATTLDTATRLQRYVIQELSVSLKVPLFIDKYWATGLAVAAGGALALLPGPNGPGSGGLILWPLFGAVNQLLAGLAFLVVAFYLIRYRKPVGLLIGPALLMIVIPAWAMWSNIAEWWREGKWLLVSMGCFIEVLQAWMILEGAMMWNRAAGVLPAPLPPLATAGGPPLSGPDGRSC